MGKYRNDCYGICDFLKNKYPNYKFEWDEPSKTWWCFDMEFVRKFFEYTKDNVRIYSKFELGLRKSFKSFDNVNKLVILDDYTKIGITID